MFKQYAEMVQGSGRYEGESPMVAFIDENDLYDETSGDVESPTGWFGRAGRWLVTISSQGFVYGHRFASVALAKDEYESLDLMFADWGDPWDDETD